MYKVLRRFEDLQDNRHLYQPGDNFPRAGLKVSEERIKELSSCENKRHVPLIKVVSQEQEKSIESEVDEEKSVEEPKSVEPEYAENTTETSLEEPKETGIEKPKPRKNRTKKEQ